jgi:hypothetical protein
MEDSNPTMKSDCYALGMVIYEVLSGQSPFATCGDDEVISLVVLGRRPERPQGNEGKLFTDRTWEVLKHCWKQQPRSRLSAKGVLMGLEGNLSQLRKPSGSYEDTGTDTDDQSDGMESEPGM